MGSKMFGIIATIAHRLTMHLIVIVLILFAVPSHRIVWHRLAKPSRRIASPRIIAWHRLAWHRIASPAYKESRRIAIAYHRVESHSIAWA